MADSGSPQGDLSPLPGYGEGYMGSPFCHYFFQTDSLSVIPDGPKGGCPVSKFRL